MGSVGRRLERQWGQWWRLEGGRSALWGEDFGGRGGVHDSGFRMTELLLRFVLIIVGQRGIQTPIQAGDYARDRIGEVRGG